MQPVGMDGHRDEHGSDEEHPPYALGVAIIASVLLLIIVLLYALLT